MLLLTGTLRGEVLFLLSALTQPILSFLYISTSFREIQIVSRCMGGAERKHSVFSCLLPGDTFVLNVPVDASTQLAAEAFSTNPNCTENIQEL